MSRNVGSMGSKYKTLLPYFGYKRTRHFIIYTHQKEQPNKHNFLNGVCRYYLFFPRRDTERTFTLVQSHFLLDASAPIRKNHWIVMSRVLGTTGSSLEDPSREKKIIHWTKPLTILLLSGCDLRVWYFMSLFKKKIYLYALHLPT